MNRPADLSLLFLESVSRRAALSRVVVVGLGLSGVQAMADEPVADVALPPSEFIPENDYPFFGCEPPSE